MLERHHPDHSGVDRPVDHDHVLVDDDVNVLDDDFFDTDDLDHVDDVGRVDGHVHDDPDRAGWHRCHDHDDPVRVPADDGALPSASRGGQLGRDAADGRR